MNKPAKVDLHTPESVMDDVRLNAITQMMAMAGSYARSAEEAAWRGDRVTLELHLKQLRLTVMEGCKVFNELERGK